MTDAVRMNTDTIVPAQAVKEESICAGLCNVNSLENELFNEMAMESMITETDRLEIDTSKMFKFLDFDIKIPKITTIVSIDQLDSEHQESPLLKILMNALLFRCQNCEETFVTKYCYQRHQCKFNAEKIILKPNVQAALNTLKQNPSQDHLIKKKETPVMESQQEPVPLIQEDNEFVVEKVPQRAVTIVQDGEKIKYMCDKCNRLFANEANLDRHQVVHRFGGTAFTCPSCNKSFIDETRLRTHQETHCKSSVLISTLYRSDIAVFQCIVCTQVFSKNKSCLAHFARCSMNEEHLNVINNEKMFRKKIREKLGEEYIDELLDSTKSLNMLANLKETDNQEKTISWFVEVLTDILYQCEFCNSTFIDKDNLISHQYDYHNTSRNFECVCCKLAINNYIEALSMHWQKGCNDELNDFHLPKMLYCQFCDKKFKSHEALYSHKLKKKHYTPKKYRPSDEFIGDMVAVTGENDNSLKVLISSAITSIENDIEKNLNDGQHGRRQAQSANKVTDKQESQQPRRGRKRKSMATDLDEFSRTTTLKDYRFQCEKCSFITEKIVELELHNVVIHISNYKCNECGQIVPTARALEIHKRMHSNLKPYVCDQCGRSYSQTSHLLQHLRFHKGIKPFACPHENCDARYTIRPDLKDHIRKVHTRERPYKCSMCQKSFLTGSVYYQHRLIHSNDRRYTCDMCGKRFFRADALNNHKRIHTNERPFPCHVCGREFRQKGDRNKHLRTQHGITICSRMYDLNMNEDGNVDDVEKGKINHVVNTEDSIIFLETENSENIDPGNSLLSIN